MKTRTGRLRFPEEYIVERIKAYHAEMLAGTFEGLHHSKSDYWMAHSSAAEVHFSAREVILGGASGYYVPPRMGTLKYRVRDWVHRQYKKTLLCCDRLLHLSAPHANRTFVTYDMAYDYIMQRHPAIDYDDTPYCFDPLAMTPPFKSSQDLRRKWFLKDTYYADAGIFTAAYYHAVFSHFANGLQSRYLEIGAGNGNLASFFKHYSHSTVTIIDLPEIVVFSISYLKSIFPNARILLPHEIHGTVSQNDLDNYDIIFITPSQVNLLPNRAFDIITNVASMQEMTHAQIEDYFKLVQRVGKEGGLWCHSNRIEKIPSRNEKPVQAFLYPYHKSNEVLLNQVDRFNRLLRADGVLTHVERIHH